MMQSVFIGLVTASTIGAAFLEAAEPVKLVQVECNQADLVMTGTELERAEKTSTIRFVHQKGGSVGSSLFILGVSLEIAEARKCEYFVNLKEWRADDGSWMIVGGFPRARTLSVPGRSRRTRLEKRRREPSWVLIRGRWVVRFNTFARFSAVERRWLASSAERTLFPFGAPRVFGLRAADTVAGFP